MKIKKFLLGILLITLCALVLFLGMKGATASHNNTMPSITQNEYVEGITCKGKIANHSSFPVLFNIVQFDDKDELIQIDKFILYNGDVRDVVIDRKVVYFYTSVYDGCKWGKWYSEIWKPDTIEESEICEFVYVIKNSKDKSLVLKENNK